MPRAWHMPPQALRNLRLKNLQTHPPFVFCYYHILGIRATTMMMKCTTWGLVVLLGSLCVQGRQLSQATSGSPPKVNICVPYPQNETYVAACSKAVALTNTDDVTFGCVAGGSPEACMTAIKNGTAQLTTLDGGDMLAANEQYGLVPLVSEYYGDMVGTSYFAVAIVKKDFCSASNATLASLKGKRSCHTGYGKTAGWTMPLGHLTEEGVMPRVSTDLTVVADAESAASFFSATCAPRATDAGPRVGGGKWDGLCTACAGDCSARDPYYDYAGSLRCLMEDAGDVAFTKHDTPLFYARDGDTPEAWSSLPKADLRLLCPTGGCKSVDEFATCNFAKVPAHAIVGPRLYQTSALGGAIQEALVNAGDNVPGFLEATRELGGQANFVFGATTQSLKPQSLPFEEYFGASTKAAYEGIAELEGAKV